jgi:hypothetical protein
LTQTIASILQPGIDEAIEKAAEHLNPSSREQRLGPLLATYARSGSGKTLLTLACYADAMRVAYRTGDPVEQRADPAKWYKKRKLMTTVGKYKIETRVTL